MDILEDEKRMSIVVEIFLRNFYLDEQSNYRVCRERLHWPARADSPDIAYLPVMETDITLHSPRRTMVIDAKYYRDAFGTRYAQPKIHSEQPLPAATYLRHTRTESPEAVVDGGLVYPSTGKPVSLNFVLHNHHVQMVTIDLDQPWPDIHVALLDILRRTHAVAPPA
jgi:5-methylcytosine-specific restriction enzyme subunit McrC